MNTLGKSNNPNNPNKLNKSRKVGSEPGFPRLLAEHLCLDFVNTIESPLDQAIDTVPDASALLRWGSHIGLYSHDDAEALVHWSEAHPDASQSVFMQAIWLREALTAIFRAIAHHELPPADAMSDFQDLYRHLLHDALLSFDDHGHYRWLWDGNPLQQVTWVVAADALELLQSESLERVKQCPGTDDCGWLFFDTSKNQSRQWCSMEGCGSRAKMRRQYARSKQSDSVE